MKKKLTIDDLKVRSFVTVRDPRQKANAAGGTGFIFDPSSKTCKSSLGTCPDPSCMNPCP